MPSGSTDNNTANEHPQINDMWSLDAVPEGKQADPFCFGSYFKDEYVRHILLQKLAFSPF
jgi:hypothetical protein